MRDVGCYRCGTEAISHETFDRGCGIAVCPWNPHQEAVLKHINRHTNQSLLMAADVLQGKKKLTMTKNDAIFKVLKYMTTNHPTVLMDVITNVGVDILQNESSFVLDQIKDFLWKTENEPEQKEKK